MQQFFVEGKINDKLYPLSHEIKYQLKKVLRASDGYEFRLCDTNGKLFLCELNGDFAKINYELNEDNELDVDITVVLSLIKNDKFDFAIQKLTELGVKRIVPYKAKRSIVKEGMGNNKLDRFNKIVKEASEQCHRNFIPQICDYATFKDLEKYKSEVNLLAYEKETFSRKSFSNIKSATILIGPEGGFEKEEVEQFSSIGFESISLGKRILRAETAAIYLSSVIVGANQ